ncbi:hypothetical protein GCM10025789_30310 [Tessaracoccus lubricantis]|uniref:Uncharacterized protein n=1 Tax=Tessaracoccus lubricantis TaxID=545543 RepID=A0ABP9FQF3_9ACTN
MRSGWCTPRQPREWRQFWQNNHGSFTEAEEYWLAFRSYPEEFLIEAASPSAWGYDPTHNWEKLIEALDLACSSSERRFLMNDALWGTLLIFPLETREGQVVVTRQTERLAQLLGTGAGDHAFRGDMMWNLTSDDQYVLPREVGCLPGELEEFLRRFPTKREWIATAAEADKRGGVACHYDELPTKMHCAVGILKYRDDSYGSPVWKAKG